MNDDNNTEDREQSTPAADASASVSTAKKKFVKPEISVPVDVLEATTFFQLTDSGGAI